MPNMDHLPVYEEKQRILETIETNSIVICIGETGSGKTTQIPQYVLNLLQDFNKGKLKESEEKRNIWLNQLKENNRRDVGICVTQPRRVAAVSVARRVAEEQHCRLGDLVGYTIRFDDVTSRATRLRYVTDGVLVRECLSDQLLRSYGVIILDEAHERSVHTDVMFGLLKSIVKKRNDIRVLVMSATLDKEKFSAYFNDAPVIEIPGRSHPVQVYHAKTNLSSISARYIPKTVDTILRIHMKEPEGDILVFLTGQDEIDRACRQLKEKWDEEREARSNARMSANELELQILPMYGSLPRHQQELVFKKTPPGCRKVIIATNIAETSITLDGIRFVVDPGLVKQKQYHAQKGIDELTVIPVSQSSALQRAGRAGRTADGKCYRLFTYDQFLKRPEETTPEIQRTSLTSTVLQLKALHVDDVINFDFIDPPPRDSLRNSLKELYWIDAINENGKLTSLGKRLARFPLEPSLSRFLLEAAELRCLETSIVIASLLSIESIFYNRKRSHGGRNPRNRQRSDEEEQMMMSRRRFSSEYGDHFTYLNVYKQFKSVNRGRREQWCRENFVHLHALRKVESINDQLRSYAEQGGLKLDKNNDGCIVDRREEKNIRRALCVGYFTRTAYALNRAGYKTVLNADDGSARIVFIDPSSCLSEVNSGAAPAWVLYHDLVATNKLHMRNVVAIRKEWVERLLPKLENTDADRLNGGSAATSVKSSQDGKSLSSISKPSDGSNQQVKSTKPAVPVSKTSKSAIELARARFMQRKLEREKANSSTSKKQKTK